MLGGRCSRWSSESIDWATSPRASSAWWLVQSLEFRIDRLGDQSPSIKCSVVGAVFGLLTLYQFYLLVLKMFPHKKLT